MFGLKGKKPKEDDFTVWYRSLMREASRAVVVITRGEEIHEWWYEEYSPHIDQWWVEDVHEDWLVELVDGGLSERAARDYIGSLGGVTVSTVGAMAVSMHYPNGLPSEKERLS